MYDPGRVDVGRVVAPPYDVISHDDQQRYYRQDPHNVVRLIAGEVHPTDSDKDNKYVRAAGFFESWLREGIVRREEEPAVYLYRHSFEDPISRKKRTRNGILAVVELEPFGQGVLPHERTHARAKADRLSLTRAVGANLSPIFVMYEDPKEESASVLPGGQREPSRLSFRSDDGDQHTIWSIGDQERIRQLAGVIGESRLYVADGHHRYETALNYRNKMRAEHPDAPRDAAFNFVLMLLVDVKDPGLVILPTHRVVHDWAGFDGKRLMDGLAEIYRLTPHKDRAGLMLSMQEPVPDIRIGMVIRDPSAQPGSGELRHFTVDIKRQSAGDPASELDVSVLHRRILQDQLGLTEAAVEEERYVSYSRDLAEVIRRVAVGDAQAAFLLRPPAVTDVVEVARAGQVMPQKSTYFYPKPASGIVFNPLDPTIRIPPA